MSVERGAPASSQPPPDGELPGTRAAADPQHADLATLRRIGIAMYAGAVVGLLCAVFGPDPDRSDHAALLAIVAAEVLAMGVLICRTPTLALLRASAFYGLATTCVCIAVARPTNGVPLYTIWPLLLGAYGFPRRDFVALLIAALGGTAVAIGGFIDGPARGALWLDTAMTVGFTALVVRFLREDLDALVRRLQHVARRLHETARRDPLTGLPNRRAFEEALVREVNRAERHDRSLAVVLLDLDHFKQVNDTHGHAEGDASLRRFAEIAHRELRASDVLGRMGGEEFALALPGADVDEARAVAERIAGRLRGATASGPVALTVSAGVALLSAAAPTGEELLRAADRALYHAKNGGRRRVAVSGDVVAVGSEVEPIASAEHGPALAPAPDAADGDADLFATWRDVDRPLMRRVALFQCLAAIPAMGTSALLPGQSVADLAAMLVLCGVLAVLAVLLGVKEDVPPRAMALLPFGGIVVISAAVAVNDPISGTPYYYLWPALYSAYFFGRRHLSAVLAAISAAYAVVLAVWVDAPLRTSDFSTVMVPVVVAAVAVVILRAQVRALVEELHRRLGELQEAASHDPLTGVLNRRAFDALLAREVDRARGARLDLSLIVVDVDHFKQVNDRLGHAGGDAALRLVAEVLGAQRRLGDLVARLGGEEFGVVLLGADAEAAADVADRIGALLVARTAGDPAPITVSAGVAALDGRIRTPGQLLVAADRALYAAKASGRARTAVWGAAMRVRPPQDLTGRRLTRA